MDTKPQRTNDNSALFAHLLTNHAPTLSAPYTDIEDAMDAAPECALVFVSREGCYQFMVCDCKYGIQQIKELARGVYECSDLSLIAWRIRGFWEDFGS